LLWIKEFERPWNGAVSDNGRIVLVHTTNRDYSRLSSSPKEFMDLESKLTVIERSGEEIFTYDFGSNVEACAISSDGNLVSVATLMPDNSVYCFDPQQKRMLWKYKNHTKNGRVLGLKFNGNEIDVFAGTTMVRKEREYALKLDGTLSQECEMQLQTLKKIKTGSSRQSRAYSRDGKIQQKTRSYCRII
jgi:outer membrane protein assembly factor BamB